MLRNSKYPYKIVRLEWGQVIVEFREREGGWVGSKGVRGESSSPAWPRKRELKTHSSQETTKWERTKELIGLSRAGIRIVTSLNAHNAVHAEQTLAHHWPLVYEALQSLSEGWRTRQLTMCSVPATREYRLEVPPSPWSKTGRHVHSLPHTAQPAQLLSVSLISPLVDLF